jgi:alkanesulfonate monooxygenase SsuD/methylene tetrahydromethanopterin reductase-like flavin-dependent oxidoreductase (luciferase family)
MWLARESGDRQLARALATLDQVTGGGRVTAGLGSGWSTDEYAASGADFTRRGQSLDEVVIKRSALDLPGVVEESSFVFHPDHPGWEQAKRSPA